MSKAFKCDRCGKCFDPMDYKDDERFASISRIVYQNGIELSVRLMGDFAESLNLCPRCTKIFKEWMTNSPIKALSAEGGTLYDFGYSDGYCVGYKAGMDGWKDNIKIDIPGINNPNLFIPDPQINPCGKSDGLRGADDIDGPDKAPERTECSEEDSKH